MSDPNSIIIDPPHYLSSNAENLSVILDQIDPATLLEANLNKMQHHQVTSQWIRTWSFAFTAFFIGYTYLIHESLVLLLIAFILVELILMMILLKDVEWHKAFWRYRDRARACEAYLLGNMDKTTMRQEYLRASEPSRKALLQDAFSPNKLITASTDFVESYLMIAIAIGFMIQMFLALIPILQDIFYA